MRKKVPGSTPIQICTNIEWFLPWHIPHSPTRLHGNLSISVWPEAGVEHITDKRLWMCDTCSNTNRILDPHPAQALKQQSLESVCTFNQVFLQLLVVKRGEYLPLLGSPGHSWKKKDMSFMFYQETGYRKKTHQFEHLLWSDGRSEHRGGLRGRGGNVEKGQWGAECIVIFCYFKLHLSLLNFKKMGNKTHVISWCPFGSSTHPVVFSM